MIILAKIILYVLVADGALMLIFPSKVLKVTEGFMKIKNFKKRILGGLLIIVGGSLFYLTRQFLAGLTAHWVIAVTSIMIFLEGLAYLIAPAILSKAARWFMSEKGPLAVIGAILIAGGIVLLKLI